jgi:hypothetical protein
MSNIVKDQECDYGFYATKKELPGSGINCNKPGTEPVDFKGVAIPLCKEHYELVSKEESES